MRKIEEILRLTWGHSQTNLRNVWDVVANWCFCLWISSFSLVLTMAECAPKMNAIVHKDPRVHRLRLIQLIEKYGTGNPLVLDHHELSGDRLSPISLRGEEPQGHLIWPDWALSLFMTILMALVK